MKQLLALVFIFFFLPLNSISQVKTGAANTDVKPSQKQHTVLYGRQVIMPVNFMAEKQPTVKYLIIKK